jgi:hypothetical protein
MKRKRKKSKPQYTLYVSSESKRFIKPYMTLGAACNAASKLLGDGHYATVYQGNKEVPSEKILNADRAINSLKKYLVKT